MVTSIDWQLLKGSLHRRGLGKARRNACVCMCVCEIESVCLRVHFYIWACTHKHVRVVSARQCERSSSHGFIFLVEGLLWCLSQWHRQINQGRVNLSRAISAEPSTVLQGCLFILHVSFEPPTPNTHRYIWTYITQKKEGNTGVKWVRDGEQGIYIGWWLIRFKKRNQKEPNFHLMPSTGVHPKLGHQCCVCGWGYFSPTQLPSREKTLQVLSWKSDEVKQKEAFMWVFCSNYFNLQNAQNSKRLHSALYALYLGWTFSGLIILCQPLELNICAVILIKTITSIALWNGKQNCWNERPHYNYLKWTGR